MGFRRPFRKIESVLRNNVADEILDAIRACTTAEHIEAVAAKYRAQVVDMEKTDNERWHHVVNAKRIYMRRIKT